MNVSDAGLKFIAAHEGSRNQPYNDPSGFATIGIGHLIGRRPVTQADRDHWGTLTEQQVLDLFREDILKYSDPVAASVKVPLTQNQFDALVSFAFNVGVGGFKGSTLLKKLNAGDYEGAANEFAKWNKSAGRVLPGLTRRRSEEADLFRRASAPVQQATRITLQRGPSDRFGRAEWLHPVFRIRLEALYDAVPFTVTSGGRSTHRQAELHRAFLRGEGNPANRPGTSWHEYDPDSTDPWTLAQAADIEPKKPYTDAHLHGAAERFGLHFPIGDEPWHIQPAEAGSSKRTAGQGLGPVPMGPDPITQDEEDAMRTMIIWGAKGKNQVLELITSGNRWFLKIESGEDSSRTIKAYEAAGFQRVEGGDLTEQEWLARFKDVA